MSDPLTPKHVELMRDIESGQFDRDNPRESRTYDEDTLDECCEAGLVTHNIGPGWILTLHGVNQLSLYGRD